MTIYQVIHRYDAYEGFGDTMSQENVVETFASLHDAQEFINHFENKHVYDFPYAQLWCGELNIEEIEIVSPHKDDTWIDSYNAEKLWWLDEEIRFKNTPPKYRRCKGDIGK